MNNEYIVINKTELLKRIEELSDYSYATQNVYIEGKNDGELIALKQILSQSTPLIPEIEKAFDVAREVKTFNLDDIPLIVEGGFKNEKQDYLSNLKLDA